MTDYFFAAKNTVDHEMVPCVPWEFKPTEEITLQIRKVKEDRQNWYRRKSTNHCFYSGIEAINPNIRVSKENPPHAIRAFAADYDVHLPRERIKEAVGLMKIKPSWIETSISGEHFRLVWLLETPILVQDRLFCTFILQQAHDWLGLGTLPGLDRKAFEETSRLYCNGCEWEATGHGPVPASEVQAFFVDGGRKFQFNGSDENQIPLDVIEKALREKFPAFDWPGPFDLETQGPTFWIPESVSPMSAVVKPGGMFTFAAHAAKPFYSWADILGSEFTSKFHTDNIARATDGIFWDGKHFWKKKSGVFVSLGERELSTFLKVECRLTMKPGKSGLSQVDYALNHIYSQQFVSGAAPFVFSPPGIIIFSGHRRLNTYSGKPIEPATGTQKWGPQGEFPFWSAVLDSLFNPPEQLVHFMAWWQYFYISALEWTPRPGTNFIMAGAAGIGKTLVNRHGVGESVGGFVDASDYLVEGSTFTAHLLQSPHWVLDDDTPNSSPAAQGRTQSLFKKLAANQQFLHNEKFEKAIMCGWNGRIGITINLDFVSTRIIGSMDNTSLDKVSLFRCVSEPKFVFPNREETARLSSSQLPNLLKFLRDWKVPDFVKRDPRYGFVAVQDKTLLTRSHQSSTVEPFKEMLLEMLGLFFKQNKGVDTWEGSVTALIRTMSLLMPANDMILRSLKLEQVSRYLESVQREGLIRCEVKDGPHKTRIWIFYRHDNLNPDSSTPA